MSFLASLKLVCNNTGTSLNGPELLSYPIYVVLLIVSDLYYLWIIDKRDVLLQFMLIMFVPESTIKTSENLTSK